MHMQAAFSGLERAVAGEQSAPGPRTEKSEQRKALYGAAHAAHAVPGHDLHRIPGHQALSFCVTLHYLQFPPKQQHHLFGWFFGRLEALSLSPQLRSANNDSL